MDYYLAPDNIHRLHEALCDLYCGYIERSVRELRPDGFWTSDDLSLFSSTLRVGPLDHRKQPPEAALCAARALSRVHETVLCAHRGGVPGAEGTLVAA
jgi:hypothetical protein